MENAENNNSLDGYLKLIFILPSPPLRRDSVAVNLPDFPDNPDTRIFSPLTSCCSSSSDRSFLQHVVKHFVPHSGHLIREPVLTI